MESAQEADGMRRFRISELELSLLQDVSIPGVPRDVADRVWKVIAKKYAVRWDSILPASRDDLRELVGKRDDAQHV